MSKRVYLAGPWVDRHLMPGIVEKLNASGHVITHPWWQYEGEGEHKESDDALRHFAELDVNGVKTANLVLVYNSAKSEGKAAEQGIAIALNKPIICVTPGERPSSNIFHYLPLYTHVTTVDKAIEVINAIQ